MKINEIVNVDASLVSFDYLIDTKLVPQVYETYKDIEIASNSFEDNASELFTQDEKQISLEWLNTTLDTLNQHPVKPQQAIDLVMDLIKYLKQ